jgi:hypothetical protein
VRRNSNYILGFNKPTTSRNVPSRYTADSSTGNVRARAGRLGFLSASCGFPTQLMKNTTFQEQPSASGVRYRQWRYGQYGESSGSVGNRRWEYWQMNRPPRWLHPPPPCGAVFLGGWVSGGPIGIVFSLAAIGDFSGVEGGEGTKWPKP